MAGRASIVGFERQGHEWYCVTAGRTLFEAVGNAIKCFADPSWRGPKPSPKEVFTVTLVGDDRRWRVSGYPLVRAKLFIG